MQSEGRERASCLPSFRGCCPAQETPSRFAFPGAKCNYKRAFRGSVNVAAPGVPAAVARSCLGEQVRRGRTVGVRVTEAAAEELREREQGKIPCPMREINNDRPLVGAWVVDGRDEAQM